jgi:epsilon-lactone hydrolase
MATADRQNALDLWLQMTASMTPSDPAQAPTPDQLRSAYDNWAKAHFPAPPELTLEPVDLDGVPCLWARTPESSGTSTILYFHGGGYMIASARGYASTAADLARAAKAQVLLVDYRLAPENPYPGALDDANRVYSWLLTQVDADSVVVAGDSAGGGLTAALLLSARDRGLALPAAAVCISAWFDMTLASESVTGKADVDPIMSAPMLQGMAAAYLQGQDPTLPSASPLFAELSGLPPLLLMTGTWDSLTDDTTRFAEKATSAGVDVTLSVFEEMYHCWHIMTPVLPESREAIEQIGRFVKQHTAIPAHS